MIAPEPHPQVICGERELRGDGSRWECVRPPVHPDDARWRLAVGGRV